MRTLAILLLGLVAVGCGAAPDQGRTNVSGIVGGMPDMTPGVVAVLVHGGFGSGSVIAKRWVLTAGHATVDNTGKVYPASEFRIVFGNDMDHPTHTLMVKSAHWHPNYCCFNGLFDVGLLELTEDAPENPLPMDFSYDPKPGQNVSVIGFGDDGSGKVGQKRSVDVKVVMGEGGFVYFLNVGEPGKSACPGDSGGPYLFNKQVVAVFSTYSSPQMCGKPRSDGSTSTGVLISPREIQDWIMKTIAPKPPPYVPCVRDNQCASGKCNVTRSTCT